MRYALDTNVLVYAEGLDEPAKQAIADAVVTRLPPNETVVPAQVLGELYNTLVRKGFTREAARMAAYDWEATFSSIGTSWALMFEAVDLATVHRFHIWDAVVLAAAAEARCDLLLSEDFQDGFAWRGVTVVNPFAAKPHKLLADLLRE